MSNIYVDREEASTILKVSTRTLDRYIRRYRFKIRKDGRRVLIKREDVDKIIKDHIGHFVDISSTDFNIKLDSQNVDNNIDNMSKVKVRDLKIEEMRDGDDLENTNVRIYKNLYIDVKKELKEKQERLEAATYRVGQLESQVKTMVPLLDYNRKEKELKEAHIAIEQKSIEAQDTINKMEKKIRAEKIAKWIYLSLVGALLVAEPVLFLFWIFS
jgi:excisionase family DNA binding protein